MADALGTRALLVGLPRSGTTWYANLLAAHPAVRLVFEPDARREALGWLGTWHVGPVPSLAPGDPAPDYHLMWRVAFAGGWPQTGPRAAGSRALLRLASSRVPGRLRAVALRGAARVAGFRRREPGVTLAKSVSAQLALEWIVEEFRPVPIVIWRHPLNVVPSWDHLGWAGTEFVEQLDAVRLRFESSPLWPPPASRIEGITWSVCAQLTVLLEAAARVPDALVVHHEATAIDPARGVESALEALGLDWHAAVEASIAQQDRPGSGWETHRESALEARRWRSRLDGDVQRAVLRVIDRFETESPVVAEALRASPAVSDR